MLFYFALLGIALVVWTILAAIVPTAAIVNVSVFGILTFVFILIGIRRGFERGRRREIFFAIALIGLYSLRGFIRTFVVGGYNAVYGLVISQLNSRGVTRINIDQNQWRLDNVGNTIFEIILFIAGAIAAYALTSGMVGGKPFKDVFGAILGGLSMALFLTYVFSLLRPFLNNVYNTNLLEGTRVTLPTIQLPGIQVTRQPGNRSPLEGWESWLPIVVLIVVTAYFLFFVKPFTKSTPGAPGSTRTDTFTIIGVALLLAVLWVFAVRPA